MVKNQSRRLLTVMYILLAAISLSVFYATTIVISMQHEIDEEHLFLNKNFLAHTQSLNRIVFSLHKLLSHENSGHVSAQNLLTKEELCRSVVSQTRFIVDLPDLLVTGVFDEDPLLLGNRLKESKQALEARISTLDRIFAEIKVETDPEIRTALVVAFEGAGRDMMSMLEDQNSLYIQFDDYIFTHLQNDIKDVSLILRSFILLHSFLTMALVGVAVLYFSFTNRARRVR